MSGDSDSRARVVNDPIGLLDELLLNLTAVVGIEASRFLKYEWRAGVGILGSQAKLRRWDVNVP